METKKIVAAMAAVNEWLREEEAARTEQSRARGVPSLWALAGRQQIIHWRSLMISRMGR